LAFGHGLLAQLPVLYMKNILLITGILIILFSLFSFLQYLPDFTQLSDYGQGFVIGKLLLLLLGGLLTYFGLKGRRSTDT
jgi:hypothetical protein